MLRGTMRVRAALSSAWRRSTLRGTVTRREPIARSNSRAHRAEVTELTDR